MATATGKFVTWPTERNIFFKCEVDAIGPLDMGYSVDMGSSNKMPTPPCPSQLEILQIRPPRRTSRRRTLLRRTPGPGTRDERRPPARLVPGSRRSRPPTPPSACRGSGTCCTGRSATTRRIMRRYPPAWAGATPPCRSTQCRTRPRRRRRSRPTTSRPPSRRTPRPSASF